MAGQDREPRAQEGGPGEGEGPAREARKTIELDRIGKKHAESCIVKRGSFSMFHLARGTGGGAAGAPAEGRRRPGGAAGAVGGVPRRGAPREAPRAADQGARTPFPRLTQTSGAVEKEGGKGDKYREQ